ncbi:microcephalin isoform X2 [Drosophila hydei]|uniref:Microcephalin isoform X2 n=1 Tax=Drosophila hydei TaxID=7224 RepID=A0A6J1M8J0_DROHY|nr:microcephalin isoform X2 [Drosophila hydei]
MWKTRIMAENQLVTVIDSPSATTIATTPAIANMIVTPKSRAAESIAASPKLIDPDIAAKRDPHLNQLQRDLNSPSAALRMRAISALKKSTKSTYNNFDVPHAEISIIAAEERNPQPPPTLSEILKDVIVYVEVRTGNDNRSEGVKNIISKLGAQTNDRLLRNTTHVVFKDGLLSTYKRAQSWNIPIVSILWIEACKVQRRLCDPKQFPISNIHMYEFPELYGKLSRVRCMQPDSELKKRKRPGTPTSSKDRNNLTPKSVTKPISPTNPQTPITRFFKTLSQTKQQQEDVGAESPATNLLNRINSGCFTPFKVQNQMDTQTPTDKENKIVANNKDATQKELFPCQEKSVGRIKRRSASVTVDSTQERSRPLREIRRSSLAFDSTTPVVAETLSTVPRLTRRRSQLKSTEKANTEEKESDTSSASASSSASAAAAVSVSVVVAKTVVEPRAKRRCSLQLSDTKTNLQEKTRNQRRRSASHNSSFKSDTPTAAKNPPTFEAITEEPQSIAESTPPANKTNYVQETMEISSSRATIIGRATERRTVYTVEQMQISDFNNENLNPRLSDINLKSPMNVTTQTSLDSIDEHTPVPVFNSTRLPRSETRSSSNRRRTLFNVDMDHINERINSINSKSQRRSLALANQAELGESCLLTPPPPPLTAQPLQAVAFNAGATPKELKSTEPKMRRLFTPNESIPISSSSSSSKSRPSTNSSNASTHTVKRRQTASALKPTISEGPNYVTCDSTESKEGFVTPFDSDTSESHGDCLKPTPKHRVIHTLVHTNMHKEQVQIIHKAIRKLRGMRLDPTVTKRTTHLVSLEPRRTLNLLRGLMRGVWIVNFKWILESVRVGKWVSEEHYELNSFSRAVEICRTERQAFGVSYRCELFRFMETFYVSSLCRPITFNNIKELLLLGGAKLTENRYKAKFIVGDKRRAEDDRVYLSPLWVLDSITAMQVQKFGKYLMKCAIVTPNGIRYEDPRQEPEDPPQQQDQIRRDQKICYKDPALVISK